MIIKFEGETGFLSNFYPAEIPLDILGMEDVKCPTVEHAYQMSKAVTRSQMLQIWRASTPGQAKRMGRSLLQIRPDWDELKVPLMTMLVDRKFVLHPNLAEKLLQTYPERLVEGNTWHDNFWGECRCENCQLQLERSVSWSQGTNQLGKILMGLRGVLRTQRILEVVFEDAGQVAEALRFHGG